MRNYYCLLFLLFSYSLLGQTTFNLRQSLGYDVFAYSSVIPVDSGYYLTALGAKTGQYQGRTQAIFTFHDTSGQVVWYKNYIGDSMKNIGAFEPTLIKLDDTTLVTVGVEFGGWSSSCFFNYHTNGDTNYIKRFLNPLDTGTFTRGDALCLTTDGGFLIGSSDQPAFDLDSRIVVRKLDSLGNEEWYQIYGSSGDYYYREQWPILRSFDNEYFLLAHRKKGLWATTSNYEYQHQLWVLDSIGSIIQSYTTPIIKPNTISTRWKLYIPKDIIKSSDGNWIIASGIGTEVNSPPVNEVFFDAYIYKLDTNFNLVWDYTFTSQNPTLDGTLSRVIELEDSSLMVFGVNTEQNVLTGMVGKLDASGNLLWRRNYSIINNIADEHRVYDVRPTPDGGYILCGEVLGLISNIPQSGWLLKLDSMGCLVPGCHLVSTTRLPDNEQIDLHIYPNPTTDYINLYLPKIEGTQNLHLHLYNLQGQLLQNHTLPQSDITYMLSTEGLSSGVYVVQVLDDEGRMLKSEKVIVN